MGMRVTVDPVLAPVGAVRSIYKERKEESCDCSLLLNSIIKLLC